jgi:hypothetical protein
MRRHRTQTVFFVQAALAAALSNFRNYLVFIILGTSKDTFCQKQIIRFQLIFID